MVEWSAKLTLMGEACSWVLALCRRGVACSWIDWMEVYSRELRDTRYSSRSSHDSSC